MITGPDEGAAGHSRLRASHADREQVIETLKTAYVDGRLDKDELDARVGQTLVARTHGELAIVTADIAAAPAPARAPASAPPRPGPARRPVNKETVKWGLVAAGAAIPPALFVTALFGGNALTPLALLALPLLVIELPIVIIFVAITLAKQRNDSSRESQGHLSAPSGRADGVAEAGQHGSTGPDPAPGARTGQTSADLRVHMPAQSGPRRLGRALPVRGAARPAPA